MMTVRRRNRHFTIEVSNVNWVWQRIIYGLLACFGCDFFCVEVINLAALNDSLIQVMNSNQANTKGLEV